MLYDWSIYNDVKFSSRLLKSYTKHFEPPIVSILDGIGNLAILNAYVDQIQGRRWPIFFLK